MGTVSPQLKPTVIRLNLEDMRSGDWILYSDVDTIPMDKTLNVREYAYGAWSARNIGDDEQGIEGQSVKDIVFTDRVTAFTNAAVLFRHSPWTFGFIKDWTANCIR